MSRINHGQLGHIGNMPFIIESWVKVLALPTSKKFYQNTQNGWKVSIR